jgi:hypothetical protein
MKMKRNRLFYILFLFIIFSAFITGCRKNDSIVGIWYFPSIDNHFEFTDGERIFAINGRPEGNWQLRDDDVVEFWVDDEPSAYFIYKFKITGNNITLEFMDSHEGPYAEHDYMILDGKRINP